MKNKVAEMEKYGCNGISCDSFAPTCFTSHYRINLISWLLTLITEYPNNRIDPNTISGSSCPERCKRQMDLQPLVKAVPETSPI